MLFHIGMIPAEVQKRPDPGMDDSIGEHDDEIVRLYLEAAFPDPPLPDHARCPLQFDTVSPAHNHGGGIIEFNQMRRTVIINLNNGKCGVCDAALLTLRQRRGDRVDCFLQRRAFRHHLADDRAGQRGQNVRFDSAAQTVGQHQDAELVAVADRHLIAAQFLILFDQRGKRRFNMDFFLNHLHPSLSSAALRRLWISPSFRLTDWQFPERRASDRR